MLERLPWLDAVRGVALGGILLANLMSFLGADMLGAGVRATMPWGAVGERVLFAINWLVEGKFYSIFSMLLGAGFVLQAGRGEARGESGDATDARFRRRMAILAGIGLAHLFGVWAGDILTLYGVMGLLLPTVWRLRPTTRAACMAALFLVPLATHAAVLASAGALDPRPPFAAAGAAVRAQIGAAPGPALEAFARGTAGDYWAWNAGAGVARPGTYLQSGRPAKVLALFLLGAWLASAVLPRVEALKRSLLVTACVCGSVGLAASYLYASIKADTGATFLVSGRGLLQTAAYTAGTTPLALAYLAVAALAWRTATLRPMLQWFVPLGRMALSAYLTQSAVQVALFTGAGLGLAGRVSLVWLPVVAVVLLVAQRHACAWWLERHAQGPAEWAWRRLVAGAVVVVACSTIPSAVRAQTAPSASPPASLSGRVVADADGLPLAETRVALDGTTWISATDPDGAFSFAGLAPGRYTAVVTRDGFETIRAVVDVTAGTSHRLDVRLPLKLAVSETVAVVAPTVGELGLRGVPRTASRLGLAAIDLPASIDVVDNAVMNARGYQKVSDAVSRLAGVVSGEQATAPSTFVVRGFTASQVATLRDGLWLGPSTMVMRPQNTFNLERVELLRGPSSAINGQGAVAGTINAVTKTAVPTSTTSGQAMLSYGQFETYQAAAGVGGPLSDRLWYRADISRGGSAGYVERMDAASTNVTGSLLWQPAPRARLAVSADILHDELPKYFGTPLVPAAAALDPLDVVRTRTGETIDARTRTVNYNVADGQAGSRQRLLRADLTWDLGARLSIANTVYGFDAERSWKNAEGYVYCRAVVDVCTRIGDVSRYYGYFRIDHQQDIVGDRLTLAATHTVAGRENRVVAGAEASTLDFQRTRGFRIAVPPAPGDAVDLLRPTPGVYGPEEIRGISPTGIDSWAVFVEDAFAVHRRVRLSGALRVDGLDLDRRNLAADGSPVAGGFTRQFRWWSWRAGAVVTLAPGVAVYGQSSSAKDPVSANVFLVNSNQNFDLTGARQWEAGLKADLARGRTQLTLAWFDITRDDVLQQFAVDSATNIGGIDARGAEAAATVQFGARARVGANAAYTRSIFRPSANFQALAGHRPPNVPRVTANAWASYQELAGLPIEVGGSARFVGERFADNANAIAMRGYALGDVHVAWTRNRWRATVRVDNVTNAAYASWSDVFYLGQADPSFLYANQLMLGPPRTVSVMLQVGF